MLFQSGKDGFPQHDPEKGPQMDFFLGGGFPTLGAKSLFGEGKIQTFQRADGMQRYWGDR